MCIQFVLQKKLKSKQRKEKQNANMCFSHIMKSKQFLELLLDGGLYMGFMFGNLIEV